MKKFKNYYNYSFGNSKFKGLRNSLNRIKQIPINFKNKTILDLGCNAGGMLFPIAKTIKYGFGYDFDEDAISLANKIKKDNNINNLDFYVMDFEKDELKFPKTDIVFMLSIANWVSNWKKNYFFNKTKNINI